MLSVCLGVVWTCLSLPCLAQSWNFQHLTIDNGLSQNSVIDITQDSLGFLWLATQDGLNQLDGTNITIHEKYFKDITGDQRFRLGRLYVSLADKLWLTNIDGDLAYYEKNRTDISLIPEIQEASCIFQEQHNQRIWIGTFGEGLFWIDETSELRLVPDTKDWNIHFMTSPKEGELLVGTEQGLYKILSKTLFPKAKLAFPKLQQQNVSCLSQQDALLYIGTYGDGLYLYNSVGALQQSPLIPPQTKILDLLTDRQGRIWVATYGDGVYLLKDNTLLQHFTSNPNNNLSINYNDVLCLFEDKQGTIWLGTDGGGVSYFKQKNNQFYGLSKNEVPEGNAVDVVRAISQDSKGTIWIGTSGKGLTAYHPDHKKLQTFTSTSSALTSNRIMSLWHDQQDHLYIGTQGAGLLVRNPQGQFQQFPNLPCTTVWDIVPTSTNTLWLCTRTQGLIHWKPQQNTWKQFQKNTTDVYSLGSNDVRTIAALDERHYFVGTQDAGVFQFDSQTGLFEPLSIMQQIPLETIGAIKDLYFNAGILWIATQRAGIIAYDTQQDTFFHYNKNKGLPNNVVYSILEDTAGFFWLSTNKGICKINPKLILSEQYEQALVAHFTQRDGLLSNEFNTGASFAASDGKFLFGALDGLNWFQPEAINLDSTTLPILFLELSFFDKHQKQHLPLSNLDKVVLQPNQNNFQIHFSALDFPLTQGLEYTYQLEGFQEEWIDNQTSNIATFSNVPSGKYQFLVHTKQSKSQHTAPARLSILIKTPWYKTGASMALYLLALSGILYWIYHFQRKRWQLQTELKLQKQESIRLQELDAFKTQLFTNISHEIRTPLTVIKGMSQDLDKSDSRKLILRNTDHLLDLTNKILDLSKLEAGLLQADYIQDDIIPYLKILCESFESYANGKNISLRFQSLIPHFIMDFDPEKIRQLISNLISNAIKFTNPNGKIEVTVNAQNQQLLIDIQDTGIGIGKEQLPYIFDRFYQTQHKQQTKTKGSGIGLALVKELVQLFKGDITVESQQNIGTTFHICLPITHNAPIQDATTREIPIKNHTAIPVRTDTQRANTDDCFVLIVEDNVDVANYIAHCLQKRYRFQIAQNGQEGLKIALEKIPDLIISDVMMPLMDGFELCSLLKKEEKTNHIPVILLTAKVSQTSKLEGLQHGADAYLIKPFEEAELLIRVEQLIQLRQKLQLKYQQDFGVKTVLEKAPSLPANPFLEKLDRVLDQYLTKEDLDIPFICQELALSRMQLHRKLKALTNQTTTQYITNHRLKKALPLLKQKDLTIAEIAFQVGFKDPNYFTRCFVKAFGMPPSEI